MHLNTGHKYFNTNDINIYFSLSQMLVSTYSSSFYPYFKEQAIMKLHKKVYLRYLRWVKKQ